MSASITEISSGQWLINITDNSNGQSYSNTVSYNSSHSSAEWIEEDPSYSSYRQIPFDNYGIATFTGGSTISSGSALNLNSASAQPVTMVDQSNVPISTPTSINVDGASFSVNRD